MPQKILAGRADDPLLGGDLVRLKVDQVVLCRSPYRAVAEAERIGMKKAAVEVAVVYDTHCVVVAEDSFLIREGLRSALSYGMLVARPGIGFPAAVHLERFAAPARLAITDDPRMAAVGGAGMLTLVASPAQIEAALGTAFGLDRELIRDETYFVAEGARIVGAADRAATKVIGGDPQHGRQSEFRGPPGCFRCPNGRSSAALRRSWARPARSSSATKRRRSTCAISGVRRRTAPSYPTRARPATTSSRSTCRRSIRW